MLFIFVIVTVIIGSLLVYLAWPEVQKTIDWFLILALGTGIGFGLISTIYFFWSIIFSPKFHLKLLLGFESIIGIIVSILILNFKHSSFFKSSWSISGWKDFVLIIISLFIFIMATFTFISNYLSSPGGGWDAVAIWNLHARFMYLGNIHWKDVFSPMLASSHPDYPYLLPGLIALIWNLSGTMKSSIPILVAAFFTFGNFILLLTSIWHFRGLKSAVMSAIVLLSAPAYLALGSSQYADIPLSFFILLSGILSILALQDKGISRGFLTLIGITLGLSIWTKNEGSIFVIAFLSGWIIAAIIKKEFKLAIKQIIWIALSLIPIIILVMYWKIFYVPPDDMISVIIKNQGLPVVINRLLSIDRYFISIKAFLHSLIALGGWPISLIIVLIIYSLFNGPYSQEFGTRRTWSLGLQFFITFIIYFFVYILTPHDLQWQLNTSLDRILIQIFPLGLFLFFLNVNDPPCQIKISSLS